MKMLKKLALVSAISAISVSAFAMEAMDDEAMATTTGQDGITINIVPDRLTRLEATAMGVTDPTQSAIGDLDNDPLTVDPAPAFKGLSIGEIRVHDDDGLGAAGAATANSGALVIGGGYDKNNDGDFVDAGETTVMKDRTVILAKGDKPIQINIDMVGDSDGAGSAGGAMLNVEIKQPALAIKLGNIYVANSNAGATDRDADGVTGTFTEVDGSTVSNKVKVLDGLEIVMGESKMTIQLGNESQGSMIVANATLVGGLTLNNFALYDQAGSAALTADNLLTGTVGSGGSFRASSIKITNNGGTGDLTANTSIDFGSRITASTVTAGATSAYQAGVVLKLQDPITASATGGAYMTHADLTDAADGADNILGNADDDATATTTLTAVNTAVNSQASGIATYASSLADDAAAAPGTWGGVDTYNGLVITSQLGGATGADITIANAVVGDLNASVMGDVQILGLMLGKSKIVIMGH